MIHSILFIAAVLHVVIASKIRLRERRCASLALCALPWIILFGNRPFQNFPFTPGRETTKLFGMDSYIEYDPLRTNPLLLQQASALGRLKADDITGCNMGDVLSFPPYSRKFKVIGINPLTIEPLDPIRFPQRYSVMPVPPSSADAPAPKPVEPAD